MTQPDTGARDSDGQPGEAEIQPTATPAAQRPSWARDPGRLLPPGQTLVPAEITTARPTPSTATDVFGGAAPAPKPKEEEQIDVDSVFGKLKELKSAD